MTKNRYTSVIVFALVLFAWSVGASAESEMTQQQKDSVVAMMMQLAQPGPEHELLQSLTGKWHQEVKLWMAPGSDPMVFTGMSVNESLLGGRFLQMTSNSGEGMFATESLNIIGFDRRNNKFTTVGFDTWGTYFVTASGDYDDESRKITMYGEDFDPIAGFTQKFDIVVELIDETKFMWSVVFKDEFHTGGGPDFKMVEVTYTKTE